MRKLAKRLVSPDSGLVCPDHWSGPDWVLTDGPAVADLNAAANFAPDPQQALGLDMIFAVGPNGRPASFAFCVVCCRQNLKTGLLKQASIGWLFLTDERRVVWSAHEMGTTRDAHADIAELIREAPALAKRLPATPNEGIYDANGQERIELVTGQVLKFKARTLSGGRGLTGDKVILDEAFALKAAHVGALLPTMTARPNGQVLYASSAGKADSDVLRDVRDRGRVGSSPRLSYLEWAAEERPCADPDCRHPKNGAEGCSLDDSALWRAANPTITTGRIEIQTIADLRQELPPEEFARECLGWWEDPVDVAASPFGAGNWSACAVDTTADRPLALGVAVGVDRLSASIAASGRVDLPLDPKNPFGDKESRPFVAAVERREGDVGWLVARVKSIQDTYRCPVIVDSRGPTADLIKDLKAAKVDVTAVTLDQYAAACASIFDDVLAHRLAHQASEELDEAVAGAAWRLVGDGRRVWGRRRSARDVSMLEAATLAKWGAEQPARPRRAMSF